ncbi:MAG: cation diffusion facilitator family transporter [Acidobacteriota bacterium]|nr:cation diffusion facilitator family transporter [Acidobacteriota bacterium]
MAEARVERTSRALQLALGATAAYILLCAVAGLRAHSLALLSEAGHNLTDFLALALSWAAVRLETRPPSSRRTYGYQRAGVLAAFLNALTLVAVSFYIFYEAFRRLRQPEPVEPGLMMAVAAAGVVMNAGIAAMLWRSGRDLNLRSAITHMLGDTVSTAAVIAGGFAILRTGQAWIDPALSFGIGALILWSSLGILRETLNILLEGAPRGMDLARIAQAIAAAEGVLEVHDLHVWSLGSEWHALSCHVRVADIPLSASERILRQVNDLLRQRFRIHHTTIQLEHEECALAQGCAPPAPDEHLHTH